MKRCKNCGFENKDDEKFCVECGFNEFEPLIDDFETTKRQENEEIDNDIGFFEGENSNYTNVRLDEEEKVVDNKDEFEKDTRTQKLILELLNNNEEVENRWTLSLLPSYTIGRISSKGSVDIDLSNVSGGEYVSRQHGKFFRSNGKWFYTDLNSKYGSELITLTSREKLVSGEDYTLSDGDILILAKKVRFRIRLIN